MNSTTAAVDNGTGCGRCIDHERYERACEETMTVEPLAPGMALITSNDETYTVDHSGACDCADARFRGDRYWCKHAIKFALVSIYTTGVTSEFIARVARYAKDHSCPSGHEFCDGPVGPRYPCAECVSATTLDDWTVWTKTAGRTGERR